MTGLLTAAFLASGFALVVFVLGGFSLPVSWQWVDCDRRGVWWFERTAPPEARRRFHEVLVVGAVAGLAATVAYDASRWAIVHLLGLDVNPYGALSAFGDALLPGSRQGAWVPVAGFGYHVVNGMSFGIAYTGLFRRRGVLAGIAFGLGLELCMLAIYPGWLDITALREFTQMSIVGHVCYGATLGVMARRMLFDRSSARGIVNVLDRAGRLWWVHLPGSARGLSSSLGFTLLDGMWIGTLRLLNVVATPAAFACGLWIGWQQPSFTTVLRITRAAHRLRRRGHRERATRHRSALRVRGRQLLPRRHHVVVHRAGVARHHDWWGGETGAYLLRVRAPLLISYGVCRGRAREAAARDEGDCPRASCRETAPRSCCES